MSKRFGRNQKRHMRERIAQTEKALEMDRALLRHKSERLGELQEDIDAAKRMVCEDSALFQPRTWDMANTPARDMLETYERKALDFMSSFEAPMSKTIQRLPLHVLLSRVDRDRLGGVLHARVMFKGWQLGYAISEPALRAYSVRDLTKRLARELAEMLAKQIKEAA